MLDGMIIKVACKVKDLQVTIDRAWTQAEAKKYPHAQRVFFLWTRTIFSLAVHGPGGGGGGTPGGGGGGGGARTTT